MAERNTVRLFRENLKSFSGSRDKLYSYLARGTALDVVRFPEEFWGPVIDTNHWTVGNGGGAGAVSPAIIVGAQGGQARLTTGTAGDNTAASTLVGGRHVTGDTNALLVARLKINTAVTALKIEVGFKDNILTTAGNGAVVNVMATPTFIATDGVCWCYDTNNAGIGWEGLGRANAVAAATDTGYNIAPVADTFEYLIIELVDGAAYLSRFAANGGRSYFGGTGANKPMLSAITATVLLAPYVYVEARTATSKSVDVDMAFISAARSTTP